MNIKEILMRRDGMSETDADDLIDEAKTMISDIITVELDEIDLMEELEDIVKNMFSLEPDYLIELL